MPSRGATCRFFNAIVDAALQGSCDILGSTIYRRDWPAAWECASWSSAPPFGETLTFPSRYTPDPDARVPHLRQVLGCSYEIALYLLFRGWGSVELEDPVLPSESRGTSLQASVFWDFGLDDTRSYILLAGAFFAIAHPLSGRTATPLEDIKAWWDRRTPEIDGFPSMYCFDPKERAMCKPKLDKIYPLAIRYGVVSELARADDPQAAYDAAQILRELATIIESEIVHDFIISVLVTEMLQRSLLIMRTQTDVDTALQHNVVSELKASEHPFLTLEFTADEEAVAADFSVFSV